MALTLCLHRPSPVAALAVLDVECIAFDDAQAMVLKISMGSWTRVLVIDKQSKF